MDTLFTCIPDEFYRATGQAVVLILVVLILFVAVVVIPRAIAYLLRRVGNFIRFMLLLFCVVWISGLGFDRADYPGNFYLLTYRWIKNIASGVKKYFI